MDKKLMKIFTPSGVTIEVYDFLSIFKELYQINRESEERIIEIEAKSKERLHEIKEKYELLKFVIEQIFKERRLVIENSIRVIEEGINKGDSQLISQGLRTTCELISQSPFDNLTQLGEALKSGKQINL